MITFKGGYYTLENLKAMHDVIEDACILFCNHYGHTNCKVCPNRRPCRDLQNFWKNLDDRIKQNHAQQKENPN